MVVRRVALISPQEVDSHRRSIDELAASASFNPFYESWMLAPALRYLAPQTGDVRLVAVRSGAPGAGDLLAVFPLVSRTLHHRLPLPHFMGWRHLHCFLCEPLVRNGYEESALTALLDWVRKVGGATSFLRFELIPTSGRFADAVAGCGRSSHLVCEVDEVNERAELDCRGSFEEHLARAMSKRHRRQLAKKYDRLAKRAPLTFRMVRDDERVDEWIESFLRQESAGWKGRAGTALRCRDPEAAFFRESLREGARRGVLLRQELNLGDTPIAMRCGFVRGPSAYYFKMAFDEEYAPYSPGALLEIEALRALLQPGTEIERVDSCAAPGGPLFQMLWPDRRQMQSVVVSTTAVASRYLLRGVACVRRLWRGIHAPPRHVLEA